MIFRETPLKGAFVLDLEPREDDRGFFARTFCQMEFQAHGLRPVVAQANIASNIAGGTMRGMHFQYPPAAESKLVSCIRGALYDVIVDLRPESPTFLQHFGIELNAENRTALYVPERFAHGYQTLCDNTDAIYLMGDFYTPGVEGGLRYDDPALDIGWPLPVTMISEKDRNLPLYAACEDELKRRMNIALQPA